MPHCNTVPETFATQREMAEFWFRSADMARMKSCPAVYLEDMKLGPVHQ